MIIAYARPFSGNEGSSVMLPELPERFLKLFTPEERDLHKLVMQDRNEVLAVLGLCSVEPAIECRSDARWRHADAPASGYNRSLCWNNLRSCSTAWLSS